MPNSSAPSRAIKSLSVGEREISGAVANSARERVPVTRRVAMVFNTASPTRAP